MRRLPGQASSLEEGLQLLAPGGREGVDSEEAANGGGVWASVENQVEHFGDGNAIFVLGERFDGFAGMDEAFFLDGEVDAGLAGFEKGFDHACILESKAELVAGETGLGDDEACGADTELVADVDEILGHSFGREVFAERTWGKAATELGLPAVVVFGGVGVDGLIGAAVNGEVGLGVAVEVETSQDDGVRHGVFEDAGGYHLSLPQDVAGHADVEGDETHRSMSTRSGKE